MNKYVDIVASLKKKLEKGCGYEKVSLSDVSNQMTLIGVKVDIDCHHY